MAKFDAATAVESLEFDFTAYGGGQGKITEPSTRAVNQFFKDMKNMMKEVRSLQRLAESTNLEEMSDDDLVDQMSGVDEAEEGASRLQQQTIENLALLCGAERVKITADGDDVIREDIVGGSPSLEDLQTLPYRVLQAFSTWFIGEIRPKRDQPAGPR